MVRLPSISGGELLKALRRAGFEQVRQKSSHVSLQKITPERVYRTVVPLHRELAKGTLRDILNQAGLTKKKNWSNCCGSCVVRVSPAGTEVSLISKSTRLAKHSWV